VKYRLNYGASVGAFPKSALDVIKRAGESELKILLCLCAVECNADEKKLSKMSGVSAESTRAALSFWRGAGVIENAEGDDAATSAEELAVHAEKARSEAKSKNKKLERNDELPNYTSEQIANLLEERKDTVTLINECQNIVGKIFNVHEINILLGLLDYLTLDFEYIMVLLTYCVGIGKKTLHYAEKLAFALYDEGICTAEQLSEELRRRERAAADEGKIRSLFGIGSRAFTSKEKKFIAAWTGEMGYGLDVITKAYEVTADATGNASFPYANTVLERWYAAGLRTLEQIEESYKKDDASGVGVNSTFDTDSFFDAAIRRAEAIMNSNNGEDNGI
jgi:DnaD/phage-associated family protein